MMISGKIKSAALLILSVVVSVPIRGLRADSLWTAYNFMNSPLPNDWLSSITFDAAGNQFIGSDGGGLVVKRDSQWTIWNEANSGVPIDEVRLTCPDPVGNLWVAATSGDLDNSPHGFGVARLDAIDSSWTMHNYGLEASHVITGIIVHEERRIVSTYGGGLTVYNDLGWIRYRFNSRTEFTYADSLQQVFDVPPGTYIPSNFIRAIDFHDASGTLWIATVNAGAVSYDGSAWATYNMGNSGLPSNQLLSVQVNQQTGEIYFGSAGFGVGIKNNDAWTVFNTLNSPMTNGFISTIEIRPSNGEMWLGTGYGVWVLQPDSLWRSYIPPDNNFIWGNFYSDISFDSVGAVWVAAFGGGMASLMLDSIPPPPPPPPSDSLYIDVELLAILIFDNRPVERLLSSLEVAGAPELSPEDSISFLLQSELGDIYNFAVPFDDFREGFFHYGGRTHHRYWHDGLWISLWIKDDDHSDIRVFILDLDAEMNRDNFLTTLTLTLGIGGVYGTQIIMLEEHGQQYYSDLNVEGESGTARAYGFDGGQTAIADDSNPSASGLELFNYPNPFNGWTTISFNLPRGGPVTIGVFDLLGRLVNEVHSGYLPAGQHRFVWPLDSVNDIRSGVYIYRLFANGASTSRKMLYVK